MDLQTMTYLVVGATFALYIGIAIWSRAASTGEFYVAGTGVHPVANGMATAADCFGFSLTNVKKEWDVYHFGLELPQSLLFAMEQEVEWWRRWKNINGKVPDFFNLIECRPLENLFPEKVTIIH